MGFFARFLKSALEKRHKPEKTFFEIKSFEFPSHVVCAITLVQSQTD
jgi:hypothetical protein